VFLISHLTYLVHLLYLRKLSRLNIGKRQFDMKSHELIGAFLATDAHLENTAPKMSLHHQIGGNSNINQNIPISAICSLFAPFL